MRQKSVTIRDVAKVAGVSIATVSDVLNRNPRTRVAPETRQRILEAARKLGYRPRRAARSLRTGLTYLLGLSVPLLTDSPLSPFFNEAVEGALKAARERGWTVTVLGFHDREEEIRLLQEVMERRSVDGVVLFDPQRDDPRWELLKGRLPFVVVGRCDAPEVVTIDNDNVEAAKLATRHLIELGHQRIAFVHVPLHFATAQDRLEGYRRALREGGIPFRASLLAEANGYYSVEAGYHAFRSLLHRLSLPPTGVVAMDDALALGVIQAAREQGLKIPEDLAVVGFNDAPFAAYCDPPLTTVRIFAKTLAFCAADMLLRLIKGEPIASPHLSIPTQLVVRASCGSAFKIRPLRRTGRKP